MAPVYDFLRPDRIPTSQLRAIHLLHENFARSLASSLSAYLRSYVIVNLVSFEQISYSEFLDILPSPTVIAGLNLRPYEGSGVLELNPTLVFPILETLLGGSAQSNKPVQREITEIEQHLIEGLLRVMVQDLRDAWKNIVPIDFSIQCVEKEPQFLQLLAPSEAVVAIGIEIRVANTSGMLNIAVPSLIIKMMRQRFDQQWTTRRSECSPEEQQRMLSLVKGTEADVEVRLPASTASLRDLIRLRPGDVLILDAATDRALNCLVNQRPHFHGRLVQAGRKRAFLIED